MNKLTVDDIQRELEAEQQTAEIISESDFAALRDLKQAGVSPQQANKLTEKLSSFANETLARALGAALLTPNQPHQEQSPFDNPEILTAEVEVGKSYDSLDKTGAIDIESEKPHNKVMTDVTIDLLDAKLEAAEARTEARVARLETLVENSIKNNETAIANLDRRINEDAIRLEKAVAKIGDDNAKFREGIKLDNVETQRYISNMKWQILGIAVAAVLAVAGLNYALTQNMMNSFSMGQSARDSVKSEVSTQTKDLNDKLDKLIESTNKQNPPRL